MFCPNCGKEIPKHVNFCPNCGTNIKEYLKETYAEGDNHKKNEYTQNYSFLEDNIFADDLNVAREDEVKVIDKDNKNDLFSNTSYFDIEDVFYVLDDEDELENIRERKKAKEEKLKAKKIEEENELKRQRELEEKLKREREKEEIFVTYDYEEPESNKNEAQQKFNTMKQKLIDEQNIDETIHEPIRIEEELFKDKSKENLDKELNKDKNNLKDTVDNAKGYVNKFIEFLKKKTKLANEKFLREYAIKGNTAGKFYKAMEIILLVLATLTPITLFLQKASSAYQITGRSNSSIWFILLAIIFTISLIIANIFTQYAGLKMASFYLDYGFDKATKTSYVLFLATLYSVLTFVLFFILKVPVGIDAILSQKILGIKPFITVILIILNIWIITATLYDRFKKDKSLQVIGMTTLGVGLSYVAIYLIMSTLMRMFLSFTVPELLKLY